MRSALLVLSNVLVGSTTTVSLGMNSGSNIYGPLRTKCNTPKFSLNTINYVYVYDITLILSCTLCLVLISKYLERIAVRLL